MKIAIICEYSGTVRDAFTALGHDATSFDLLPTETPGKHVQGNIQQFDRTYWSQFDLAICHPPCTHLAVSGAAWFKYKQKEQVEALEFVRYLMNLPILRIAIENPVSIISSKIRKPDQIIHPYMFGHMEQKTTCLWLKNLPDLKPTSYVFDEMMLLPKNIRERLHYLPPGPDRWKERSKTYSGIAEAMATQWSQADLAICEQLSLIGF